MSQEEKEEGLHSGGRKALCPHPMSATALCTESHDVFSVGREMTY